MKQRKAVMARRSTSLIGSFRNIVSFDRLQSPIKKVRTHKRGTRHFIYHYTDQGNRISAVEIRKKTL